MLSKILSILTLFKSLSVLAKRFGLMTKDVEARNENGTAWTGAPGDDTEPTYWNVKPTDQESLFAGIASFLALQNLFD